MYTHDSGHVFAILQECESLRKLQKDESDGDKLMYIHHENVDDIYAAMSRVVEDDILQGLQSAPYGWFSLMLDEGTDTSNKSTLMIYIRHLTPEGEVHSRFLDVVELPGCTATDIFSAAKATLEKYDLDVQNLMGLATDGASVMTGSKRGVTTKFKELNPYLIANHCTAHRLALASEKAASQVQYLSKYLEITNKLGKMVKYSPKFCRILEECKLENKEKAKKLKQVFFTRWLSFGDCVQALVCCLASVLTALKRCIAENSQNVSYTALLKSMSNIKFIGMTFFLADAVGLLATLSKSMQKESLVFADCAIEISATAEALRGLQEKPGPYYTQFLETQPDIVPENGERDYNGHIVKDNAVHRSSLETTQKQFVAGAIDYIGAYFPKSDLMHSFSVFDPRNEAGSEINDSAIENLSSFFGSDQSERAGAETLPNTIISKEHALREWEVMKNVLPHFKECSMLEFYQKFLLPKTDAYPNLVKLATLALLLPSTSVECERGFSHYNIIKSDHRSCLKVESVKALMILGVESPTVRAFPFNKAFENWITKRERRAFQKAVSKRATGSTEAQRPKQLPFSKETGNIVSPLDLSVSK